MQTQSTLAQIVHHHNRENWLNLLQYSTTNMGVATIRGGATGAVVRVVRMDVPKPLCFHLNAFRSVAPTSPEHRGVSPVPPVVIHTFYKNLDEPSLEKEGLASVVRIGIEHFDPTSMPAAELQLLRCFLA